MELDILNEIMSHTVSDLFFQPFKYSMLPQHRHTQPQSQQQQQHSTFSATPVSSSAAVKNAVTQNSQRAASPLQIVSTVPSYVASTESSEQPRNQHLQYHHLHQPQQLQLHSQQQSPYQQQQQQGIGQAQSGFRATASQNYLAAHPTLNQIAASSQNQLHSSTSLVSRSTDSTLSQLQQLQQQQHLHQQQQQQPNNNNNNNNNNQLQQQTASQSSTSRPTTASSLNLSMQNSVLDSSQLNSSKDTSLLGGRGITGQSLNSSFQNNSLTGSYSPAIPLVQNLTTPCQTSTTNTGQNYQNFSHSNTSNPLSINTSNPPRAILPQATQSLRQTPIMNVNGTTTTTTIFEEWLRIEAPKRLEESLKRLGFENAKFSMRGIKDMSEDTLNSEKKKVKNELKLYDQSFEAFFHQQPTRNQKEPMRPLYVYYKALKQALTKLPVTNENAYPLSLHSQHSHSQPLAQINHTQSSKNQQQQPQQQQQQQPLTSIQQNPNAMKQQQQQQMINQVNTSQKSAQSDSIDSRLSSKSSRILQPSNQQNIPIQMNVYALHSQNLQSQGLYPQYQQKQFNQVNQTSKMTSENSSNNVYANPVQTAPSLSQYQQQQQLLQQTNQYSQPLHTPVQPTSSNPVEVKIAALKKQRAQLRENLQTYQDDFYRTHNRKIKFHKDILPIEPLYKEYKDIKKEIIALEASLQPLHSHSQQQLQQQRIYL